MSASITTCFRLDAAHDPPALRRGTDAEQRVERVGRVADGRREAPRANARLIVAQPRQRQLDLHAALGSHELVPFVDDDERGDQRTSRARRRAMSRSERISGVVTSAVGRRRALSRAHRRGRVARARLERPRNAEVDERLAQRLFGVGGERAERRDPEHAKRRRGASSRSLRCGRLQASSVCSSIHSPTGPPHAASVFPVPVAAWIKPLSPARYAAQTSRWKANGDQPRAANQSSNVTRLP